MVSHDNIVTAVVYWNSAGRYYQKGASVGTHARCTEPFDLHILLVTVTAFDGLSL